MPGNTAVCGPPQAESLVHIQGEDSTVRDEAVEEPLRRRKPSTLDDASFLADESAEDATTLKEELFRADVDRLLGIALEVFCDAIETQLNDDLEEASALGEVGPSRAAIEGCKNVAQAVGPKIIMKPALRCAAFSEGDGGASLVIQSLVSDRRVNLRVLSDGTTVQGLEIDENMNSSSFVAKVSDYKTLKERAAWVIRRA